jgi:putative transposase
MKRKRFTEEQIIGVLKEAEAGAKPAELWRRHGISEATYYNWKAKYAGTGVRLTSPRSRSRAARSPK